jgi:hypothetical protein
LSVSDFSADPLEMESGANTMAQLAARTKELHANASRVVDELVRVNGGVPSLSAGMTEFNAAVRRAVEQIANDLDDQSVLTDRAAATFQQTDDERRTAASKMRDGLTPASGSGAAQ